jgi:hypothetical protein
MADVYLLDTKEIMFILVLLLLFNINDISTIKE